MRPGVVPVWTSEPSASSTITVKFSDSDEEQIDIEKIRLSSLSNVAQVTVQFLTADDDVLQTVGPDQVFL